MIIINGWLVCCHDAVCDGKAARRRSMNSLKYSEYGQHIKIGKLLILRLCENLVPPFV